MKKHSFQRQNILIIGIFCLIVQVIHAPPIELKNLNFKPDNYKLGTDGIAVVFGGKDPHSDIYHWRMHHCLSGKQVYGHSAPDKNDRFRRLAAGLFAHVNNSIAGDGTCVRIVRPNGRIYQEIKTAGISDVQQSHNGKFLLVATVRGRLDLFQSRRSIVQGDIGPCQDISRLEFNSTDEVIGISRKIENPWGSHGEISIFDIRQGFRQPLQKIETPDCEDKFTFSGVTSALYLSKKGQRFIRNTADVMYDYELFAGGSVSFCKDPVEKLFGNRYGPGFFIDTKGHVKNIITATKREHFGAVFTCKSDDPDIDLFFVDSDSDIIFPHALKSFYRTKNGTIHSYNAATEQVIIGHENKLHIVALDELIMEEK